MPEAAPQLIETMCFSHGHITLWPCHRARLIASARTLGYPLDLDALQTRLQAFLLSLHPATPTVRLWGLPASASTHPAHLHSSESSGPVKAWRIRLLLAADGELSLESTPLPATPTPVRIALASDVLKADPEPAVLHPDTFWLRHKTMHRPWFTAAQRWLQAHPDHFDLIFGNTLGELCEGSRSNIYVRTEDGQWLTPPVACGLLPGVQRQALLDQGAVREAPLSLNDLRQAPALRISNALRGWLDARLSEGVGPVQF